MNANCFKTVFSERLGCLIAVGEHACSQGKSSGEYSFGGAAFGASVLAAAGVFIGALVLSQVFVGLAWAQPAANALPTGATVVQGAASLAQSANQLHITQSTQRAAINWQSFDIGAAAKVNVVQPNAQAVLLNRVVGQSPSQIFGQLQANGHVILVNPNGVLFGKDGSVNAGSFTASTLGISDANFMAGNMVYERNGSTAGVVNQGQIEVSPGGYVALLGASVSNEGKIIAPKGGVALGAAETIKVPVTGSGRIKLELTAGDINASVKNSGSIVSEGGQVYMQALALNRAAAQILQSGRIDTTGEQGGAVHLLADGGTIKVDGSISANSTGTDDKGQALAGGDIYIGRDKDTNVLAAVGDVSGAQLESRGGFVETSGQYLVTTDTRVLAKDWLLDPSDITISTGANSNVTGASPADTLPTGADGTSSVVNVSTIQSAINAGTNVTIKTTNANNTTGAGNITIANPLVFNNQGPTDATLSLIADNGITQNSAGSITTQAGSAKLVHISMTANGNYQGNSAESTLSRGLTLNAKITTNGQVSLTGTSKNNLGGAWNSDNTAFSGVVFGTNSGISASRYEVTGSQTATSSWALAGVIFNGSGITLTSSSGDSFVRGNRSSVNGSLYGAGVHFRNNSGVTIDTGNGAATTAITGTNVRISTTGDNVSIVSKGNVTIGSTSESMSYRAGNVVVQSGTFSLLGSFLEFYNPGANLTGWANTTTNLKSSGAMNLSLVGESGGTLLVGNNATLNIEAGTTLTSYRDISAGAVGGTVNIKANVANIFGGNNSVVRTVAAEQINVQANNLVMNTGSRLSAVNTAAISTLTAANAIQIGAADGAHLGISQAELNQISASTLRLGGASQLGQISVVGATTTLAATGHLALQTAGNIAIGASLSVGDDPATISTAEASKNLTLSAGGAVSRSGITTKVSAADLSVSAGSTIGSSSLALLTNVNSVSLSSAGDQYLVEDNGVNLAARTTGNGLVNVSTTNGTLTVGTANGLSGVDAGSGHVNLSGTASTGHGVVLSQGTSIEGGNITVTAAATGTTGTHHGFWGQGGAIDATGTLSVTGTSTSANGSGLESAGDTFSAVNGLTLSGAANGANTQAMVLGGSSVHNSGGATNFLASRGSILTQAGVGGAPAISTITHSGAGMVQLSAGSTATDAGAVDGTALSITQNGAGGVLVKTAGSGHVTAPKITNTGPGDVVVAAGAALSAGTGSGGQVLTVSGNDITTSGRTYLYTGSASGSGILSHLGADLQTLFYNGTTHSLNASFGAAYGGSIVAGADTQVLFREAATAAPGFTLALPTVALAKSYGDVDPDVVAAFQSAYVGAPVLTASVSGVGGHQVFGLAALDALATLSGPRMAGENASDLPYSYTLSTGLNTSLTGQQPALQINRKVLSAALQGSVSKEYDGTNAASLTAAHYAVTGWATMNGVQEGSTVTQTLGSYTSKDVANNTGAGSVTATLEAADFSPTGSTLLSNYVLPTTVSGNVGTITRAPLAVNVGNTAMFVTQDPNTAFDTGIAYVGLKNGETSNAILGALTRAYVGFANPGIGLHSNVYGLSAVPTAANYTVSVNAGDLNVLAADKLLIQVGSRSQTYGAVTASNAGVTTAAQGVSALYCVGGVTCNTISALSLTDLGSGNWRATDTLGSSIRFSTGVDVSGAMSPAGYLSVGNYDYSVGSLTVEGGQNFTSMALAGGALTITPKALSLTAPNVTKVYDGSDRLVGMGLTPSGALAGDVVTALASGGTFAGQNAGAQTFTLSGLQLQGADKANYSLGPDPVSGTGSITPKTLSLSAWALNKTFDGTTSATVNWGALTGLVGREQLGVSALGLFGSADVGNDKPVNVMFSLANGANGGLASNYVLAPQILLASILKKDEAAPVPAPAGLTGRERPASRPVQPEARPQTSHPKTTRVVYQPSPVASASQPALGRSESGPCSDESIDSCLCEDSPVAGIQICYVPKGALDNEPTQTAKSERVARR
jgi:filamentous hemagglutinin family protein